MSITTHPFVIRIADWIARRQAVEHGDVLLDRKRVYILPTRAGLIFGAAMVVLLIGSINYGLQLGFLLTFLVTSIAVVGMYHTHRNLARVLLRGHRAEPVFAGDVATFELLVTNPTPEARYALNFAFVLPTRRKAGGFFRRERPMPGSWVDVPANGNRPVGLSLPTRRRGRRACPRVRIETRFPFGLWQAWAYFTPALSAIVYPRPEADAPPLPLALGGSLYGAGIAASGEDFAGVRPYQAGDSQRMIAWKLAARSDELSVKLFEAAAGGELVLDYDALPAGLGVERRLARLARWVLDADAAQLRYALRLPGTAIALGSGADHRDRCLTALALFRA
ncbi:MAG: DUF58 domain-containing protein [Burkholderiaceae bacterium]